ncbi:MAG TPA: energy transducer TonB [Thermoanaerobaculia bacterium]|jgi:TonB family protein|nr:energy transducer TonB [Thermoanaerobaculia bacterium]
MRRDRIHLLALALAPLLAACASAAQPAANQASAARGGAAGTEEACRTYSPPNMTGVSPPKLLHGDQPDPSQLSSKSGYACVRVTITTSGSVTDAQVVQTDNDELARAFVHALADWKYEPATRGTAKVPYHTVLFAKLPG